MTEPSEGTDMNSFAHSRCRTRAGASSPLARGPPAVVRHVRPYTHPAGVDHFVDVEYLDGWDFPGEDGVVWELERRTALLTSAGLPRVDNTSRGGLPTPMGNHSSVPGRCEVARKDAGHS